MTFTEHPEWPTMLGDTTDLGRGRIGCKDSREYFRSITNESQILTRRPLKVYCSSFLVGEGKRRIVR